MSNPVPSDKISDGKLNFESLDQVVNGEEMVTTRKGKQIMPISMIVGIVEQRKDAAIGTIDGYVAQVESSRNSAINTINQAEADVQQELQDAISRTGYNFIGEFSDGATLESRVDALRFEGEWYRWDGALPKTVPAGSTPQDEGGVGSGAWVSVGDAAIRGQLIQTQRSVWVAASDAPENDKILAPFVCDGVDDHEQVFAAIAKLEKGGTVRLSQGTFVGRFGIDKDNIRLTGFGRSTILKTPDGLTNPAQVLTIAADYCKVDHLAIDGNKYNWGEFQGYHESSDGIGIYGAHNVVEHCYVTRAVSHGIIVWNRATTHPDAEGAPNAPRAAGIRDGNHILYNVLEDTGSVEETRAAIDLAITTDTVYSVVHGNYVIGGDNTLTGITLHSGSKSVLTSNIIRHVSSRAFDIHSGAHDVTIGNNTIFITGTEKGIRLNGVSQCAVTGNVVKVEEGAGNNVHAIECPGQVGENVTISGNVFDLRNAGVGSSSVAMRIAGSRKNYLFTGNIFLGASSGQPLLNISGDMAVENIIFRGNFSEGHSTLLNDVSSNGDTNTVSFFDHMGDNNTFARGEWTPSFEGDGDVDYIARQGSFVRHGENGELCTVYFDVVFNKGATSDNQDLTIAGLPMPVDPRTSLKYAGTLSTQNAMDYPASAMGLVVAAQGAPGFGGNSLAFRFHFDGQDTKNATFESVQSGNKRLSGSITYQVGVEDWTFFAPEPADGSSIDLSSLESQGLFDPDEGTLFVRALSHGSADGGLFGEFITRGIYNRPGNNRFEARLQSGAPLASVSHAASGWTDGGEMFAAYTWKRNDTHQIAVNGAFGSRSSLGDFGFSPVSPMQVGGNGSNSVFAFVAYRNRLMSQIELQQTTSV